jgi:hypothetical protein
MFPLKLYTTNYPSFMRMSYENLICLFMFVFFFRLRNALLCSLNCVSLFSVQATLTYILITCISSVISRVCHLVACPFTLVTVKA